MKEYNYDEIRRMQEKALERVRDMQTRTHQLVNGENEKTSEQKAYRENFYNAVKSASKADYIKMPVEYSEKITDYESFEKYFGSDSAQESTETQDESTTQEVYEKSDENPDRDKSESKEVPVSSKPSGALEKLIDEPDKALLLALLLLFQAEKANEELIMSLLYIML